MKDLDAGSFIGAGKARVWSSSPGYDLQHREVLHSRYFDICHPVFRLGTDFSTLSVSDLTNSERT